MNEISNNNNLEYKVKINNNELVSLCMLDFDKNQITSKDLKCNKPIAYHKFAYDTRSNIYKSINNDNTENIIKNGTLYSKNIKYKYETGWEMCHLCRENDNKSIIIWSWEFDNRLIISNLFLNLLFMTFESNSYINWYISNSDPFDKFDKFLNEKKDSNEICEYVNSNFLLLPLELPNSPIYFDKKLDLSDYFKVNHSNSNTTKFYLACIMDKNRNDKTQLFRMKSENHLNKFGQTENKQGEPLYEYPFQVYFNLSQKSIITNELIGDDDDDDDINNQEDDNYYYFNEEDEYLINKIKKCKLSKIHKWSINQVQQWLFNLEFYSLLMLFKELRIDGIKLLNFKIELLPLSFTDNNNNNDKLKFINELNKLLIISGQRNNNYNNNLNSTTEYSNHQHQYKQDTSTILSLKSSILQKKQLIRKKSKKNENDQDENEEIKLLNDENTTNYKFIIQDRILNVHKEILIKSSEYFKTLLCSGDNSFKESIECQTKFEVDESLTFNSLKNVLELIYMNSKEIQLEFLKSLELLQLKSILILSDRFLLIDSNCKLSQLIENYIIWLIDSKNIHTIYKLFNFNFKINNFINFILKYLK